MAGEVRSADELVRRACVEPGCLDRLKEDPIAELQRLAKDAKADIPATPPLESDVWIYRLVVVTVGATALIAIIGAIVISIQGGENADVPDVLTAIGSAAIGALAGLITPFSSISRR